YDVTLDLVGWPEEGTGIIDNIMTHSLESNIGDRIHYHGYKPVGPELFEFYKNADIYIIASQTSEGFPRTIWEAMAHSLPVVATRVGSIPDFIEGMAELVEPKNSQAIADGVEKIITDGAIRKEYIKLGSRLAHQYTLDIQVEEMAKVISDWLD
ncbi:MAG: glycosyltransferase family 4 protein, partial [Anaerolineaceae bacterium]|nr:glycosyltransferase family 4 protein [Anaerolineaceae bacterium]